MLGWYFCIYTQADRVHGNQPAASMPKLATWEAGIGGTKWLHDLATEGKAVVLGGNGYPDRYTVSAGALQSILLSGLPKHDGVLVIGDDYVLPAGWTGKANIDLERLRSIDRADVLLVEAWDQS